ncbi:MAG: DNA methyltransferase [Actinomycetota bacterium]
MTTKPESESKLVSLGQDLDSFCRLAAADLREVNSYGERPEDNLLVHGDAAGALEALTQQPRFAWRYAARVKLAYLDPPFNTGSNFPHYRDNLPRSVWSSLIRDTLDGIKQIIAENGSVWFHLNDAEQHRARCLLDEVFGSGNFVATVIWDKTPGPRPNANPIAIRHEYIHVYRKSRLFSLNGRLDSVWSYKDVGAVRTASGSVLLCVVEVEPD